MGKCTEPTGERFARAERLPDPLGPFYDEHASWMLLYVRQLLRRFRPVPVTLLDAHDVLHAFLLHALVRGWLERDDMRDPRRFYSVAIWRWLRGECRREDTRRARFERGVREKRVGMGAGSARCPLARLAVQDSTSRLMATLERFRQKRPTYARVIDALVEWAPRRPPPEALAERFQIPRHRVADLVYRARCAFRQALLPT